MTAQPCPQGSALTPGPLVILQVKNGSGRLFFICISLMKNMVQPLIFGSGSKFLFKSHFIFL